MKPKLQNLFDAFARLPQDAPVDPGLFYAQLPEPDALPSPWETWVLLGLVRHLERHRWVAEIVASRLQGDPELLSSMGGLGHPPNVSQFGTVPGMPEYEYFFHGIGCCITHKVSGDAIDVDFHDNTSDYFDTYFYANFLKSLGSPDPVEQRICTLHRSLRPIPVAIDGLIELGALEWLPERDSGPYRLSDITLSFEPEIRNFIRAWDSPKQRNWLAGIIGDWPFVLDAAVGSQDDPLVRRRAAKCIEWRVAMLQKQTGYSAADALFGLAELNRATAAIEAAFEGAPGPLVSAALEIVGQQDSDNWCEQILQLFRKTNPEGPTPEPHIWTTCVKFLLRRNHAVPELLSSLPRAGGTGIGRAVLLALEFAPHHALSLIRKGLTSSIPINRQQVAAILALFGKTWSTKELLRALAASTEQEQTAEVRAAIRELGDREAEKLVLAWEEINPHEKECGSYTEVNGRRVGPFHSMAEHALVNCPEHLRYEMQTLHDRVMKLRHVVPPNPELTSGPE